MPAGWYPGLRLFHIGIVLASGGLFLLRGIGVLLGAAWPMRGELRYLSYGIDTLLLAAGLLLIASLPSGVFANGWLAVKLLLLLAYIVAGSLALKRAPTRAIKAACFLLAIGLYAAMFSVARAHDPLAPLRPLLS